MKTSKFALLVLSIVLFASCSSDDDGTPDIVNPEEVITTLTLTLTPADNSTPIVLKSVDLDGDGPNAPSVTVSGNLAANTTYTGAVEFLNETESPAEDITAEVQEESDEHQVIYTISSTLQLAVTYADFDGNNNPLGTAIGLTTTDASEGPFTVTLRHEPTKPNDEH